MQAIAITMGDAAGISPEIIARAFRQPALTAGCFVAGDVQAMRRAAAVVADGGIPLPVLAMDSPQDVAQAPPHCIPVLQVGDALDLPVYGRISAQAGEFAGRCVAWAADAALQERLVAIVTAPLHKEALAASGAPYNEYPGHTEMLQALAASHAGRDIKDMPVRMMLANDELRTVLVSIHLSLRDALDAVTCDNILQTLQITHTALRLQLGRTPRIAVAGLNPHAGEGGRFGSEEVQAIAPAVALARERGMDVTGPLAPDTVFMRARRRPDGTREFDVVVAMYHDQGLIPVKYLGVEQGVNVTLGLPFVRTSPDHGTAFDIAGTGQASEASLLAAISIARSLAGGSLAIS